MTEINCFADFKTTAPSHNGELAYLKHYYHNDDKYHGSGQFIGFTGTTSAPEDGGTLIKGNNFYWKRISENINSLNLYHFGAHGDGKTDDSGAFINMFNWSQSCSANVHDLPVRFPPGTFLINPVTFTKKELPFFAIHGDDNPFGIAPRTTIISDKSPNTVFHVSARRISIRGITWDGRAVAEVKDNKVSPPSNVQPFLLNDVAAGEFVNIYGFRVNNNGGTAVKLVDTLDTRLEQIYSSKTYARVFDIGWTDTKAGNWNHSTAIELSNANFQYGYGDATLYMPRTTQGLIRNVWIEHTLNPGNLTDGQWIIDALSVESSVNPLHLKNSRVLFRQLSLQAGASIDHTDPTNLSTFLSAYEEGWRRDENFGTEMTGSMKSGWYSGYRLTNDSDQDKWFKVGTFHFPEEHQLWAIEFLSKISNQAVNGVADNPITSLSTGLTRLNLQRCTNNVEADMHHNGSPALVDVRCFSKYKDFMEVWVKLHAKSGDTLFNLTSTGPTRFDTGACTRFEPSLTEEHDEKNIMGSRPSARFSVHNGVAGFGANEKGIVTLATSTGQNMPATHPSGYMIININGHDRKVPYYE